MSAPGDKNVYWCPDCHGYVATVHADRGVTPMFLACRVKGEPTDPANDCKGMMHSQMYPPEPWPEKDGYGNAIPTEPTYEWYVPPRKKWRKLDPDTRDHVARGGCLLRRASGLSDTQEGHE